jgi:lysophospholipase L1-like esterase
MRSRHLALAVAAAMVALLVAGCVPSPPPLPNSMASTGDSITRAFDVDVFHALADTPQYSWSTGYSVFSNSQYRQILRRNPAISGHEFNDARTGAKMVDLDGQVLTAKAQGAQYLTVLMGANDLCTSSAATMTPTATLRAQFTRALRDFTANNANAKVFVSSIPNLYQLWSVLHTNPVARGIWSTFGICQSMLGAANTEAQRQQVVAQEAADNTAMQQVCETQFAGQCRWDKGATFHFAFTPADVSTVDYFHPSLQGQNNLAAVSFKSSYWG